MPSVPPVRTATFPITCLQHFSSWYLHSYLKSGPVPPWAVIGKSNRLRAELDGSQPGRIRRLAYKHEKLARGLMIAGFLTPHAGRLDAQALAQNKPQSSWRFVGRDPLSELRELGSR